MLVFRAAQMLGRGALGGSMGLGVPSVAIGMFLLSACTGIINDRGNAGSGSEGSPIGSGGFAGTTVLGNSGSAGSGPGVNCQPGMTSPGVAPLRRLTQVQYNNTVRDLLGDTSHPGNDFPPDEFRGAFSNQAVAQSVSPVLAQGYQTAAESVTAKALAHPERILPCDPKTGEDACARLFIQKFGRRAYRRPPTDAEVSTLFNVYKSDRADGNVDFNDGMGAVIETILQSAPFLYRPEVGGVASAGTVALNSYEVGARLSYTIWNSLPDSQLEAAADADQLRTPEQVATQARRMLADPKALTSLQDFFDQWLGVSSLTQVNKDAALFPEFTSAVQASMATERHAFLDYVMGTAGGTVDALLTAPFSFLDKNTGPLYGISGLSDVPQKTMLDPSQRAGILTQPGLMAIYSHPNQTSPVPRGKFVRERLLCEELAPPPPGLIITVPEVQPGSTARQRFAVHDASPSCSVCHVRMDPIGFGFEHMDPIGRYRTLDQGLPVDSAGHLSATGLEQDFSSVPELARLLVQSSEVQACVVTQWFRYASGRTETPTDTCSIASVLQTFNRSKGDIRELIVALAQSDAFRYRPEVTQ